MRYHLICTECFQKGNQHGQFTTQVSPNNEGIYNVTCPEGHKFNVDILSHHFQVLFENGIHALSDNYFIESFVSFAASYERFIEYFLRVVLISNEIEQSKFDDTWKELAKQSERQLGAFLLIYLQEFKEKPIQLPNSMKELRNKVIHKGYLPTHNECIKFGNSVLNFIRPIIVLLKANNKYENELLSSVGITGNYDIKEIHKQYVPYQIFAINRPLNKTDEKNIEGFLETEKIIKNRA